MIVITEDQKEVLFRYLPEAENIIANDDFPLLLDKFDTKITEIGFNNNYELNKIGLILQKLYDDIFYQNEDWEG